MSVLPFTLGAPLLKVANTASTNNDLKQFFRQGKAAPGTLLVAERQSAGRGQFDRRWWSPPAGGLFFSLLLPLQKASLPSPLVPLLCGLALARAVEQICSFTPQLKWPNDLLAEGKKCAGILCETVARGAGAEKQEAVVAGVGINGHVPPQSFPAELRPTAGSLHLLAAKPFEEGALLASFLQALAPLYLSFFIGRDDHFLEAYRRYCPALSADAEWQICRALGRGC